VDLLAILLAVWKIGAVYVPVDPNYPVAWVARILDEVEPRVVVVEPEAEELGLDRNAAEIVTTHALWREDEGQSFERSGPKSGDLAYISYTSGSTGRPKGVQIEHGQLINCLHSLWEAQPFVSDDVVAQKTATGFVVHLKEMLAGLLVGAEQWIAPDDLVHNIPAFARALAEHRVTRLNLVPSQLAALLDHAESLSGIRWVITAGEPLPELLRARFERLLPKAHLYNNYGCTELNDITYYHAAGPGVQEESGSEVPIGTPIANTQIHLLDEFLRPVPPGVIADLWVEGAAVGAHGYYRWPELTAERWITKPGDKNGTRLFRTGDLAQLSRAADGSLCLEYCGRADFQVKLRGQKVDPLGIEQVLAEHPALSGVAVRGWNSGTPDALLAAYYVLRPETALNNSEAAALNEARPDHNQLYRWLQERLPAYMVPSAWVQLNPLPLLPNGKLNRGALPYPEIGPVSDQQSPRDERERALAELWAQVLRVPVGRIGREDNFFSIGGNSMLAVQLVERMRAQGWIANVQMLFDGSTLKDLAVATTEGDAYFEVPPNLIPDFCKAVRPEMLTLVSLNEAEITSISRQIPGGPSNIQDIYPLAPLQEGLLFHYLANRTGDPYLLNTMLAVKSRENALALLDALQWVVDRHDILRTAVLWKDLSEPIQVVLRKAVMPVEEIEIPSAATGSVQYLNERFDPRQYRMDLAVAPLVRACLAKDEEHDRWIVLLLFHHLVTDRVSLELVHREIETHLRGRSRDLPPALPYRDFVAHARLKANRTEQENFFRKMLGDFDEPTKPLGISGMSVGSMCETSRRVEARLALRLREHARSLGVTAASLFHLAWAYVLAETSGNDDIVFGTTLSGRMHAGAGADQVLGLFVNTLPIRVRIGQEDALTEVRQVNQTLSALLSFEQTPLSLAQQYSGISTPHPLFLAVLNYRHYGQSEMNRLERPFPIKFLSARDGGAHPLRLAVDDMGDGFVLRTSMATNSDTERICDYVHYSLEHLAEALEEEEHEH
jgi:arthrofactin-type cyclic lipopeptide synthetase C